MTSCVTMTLNKAIQRRGGTPSACIARLGEYLYTDGNDNRIHSWSVTTCRRGGGVRKICKATFTATITCYDCNLDPMEYSVSDEVDLSEIETNMPDDENCTTFDWEGPRDANPCRRVGGPPR